MKTGVTVRKATAKDAAVIVMMWKEFMEEADREIAKKNPEMKAQLAKKRGCLKNYSMFIGKKLRSKNAVVFLAESGSHAIGYSLNYTEGHNLLNIL